MTIFTIRVEDVEAVTRYDVGPSRFTLARNVASEPDVRDVVATMVGAGGTVVKEPQPAVWGGYRAFVADPVGLCWEVAHNPSWSVDDDGTVHLGGDRG